MKKFRNTSYDVHMLNLFVRQTLLCQPLTAPVKNLDQLYVVKKKGVWVKILNDPHNFVVRNTRTSAKITK